MKNLKAFLALVLVFTMFFAVGCGEKNSLDNSDKENAVTEKKENNKKIKIRIGHDNNVQTPGHKAFLEFEKLVENKSEGRMDVEIYPGAQLGSVQDMFEQTRRGDIEMSISTTSNFIQTIPEFSIWDNYYLFDDAEHAHRVLDGEAGKELMKPLEDMNLVGLGYMEIGFRNFSNSKRPIMNVNDLDGLKIRGYNPIQIKAWESLGVQLTNLSWPEVFTSLQQNLIDGQECATASFYSAKFYEAQKYWSLTKHVYTNWLWFANKDFMDSLSPEDRKMIEEAAKETIKIDRELLKKAEQDTLDKLPELGIEVNEVPLETRKEMGELMNGAVKEDIIATCGQDIYDLVIAEVESERK